MSDHTPSPAPDRSEDRGVAPDAAPARRAADRPTERSAAHVPSRAGHEPRTARPDRALHLLLLAAEREARVGMTISAGGVTVSGRLVSTKTFGRALADQFTSAGGMTEMDASFAEALRDLVDHAIDAAQGDRRAQPDADAYEHATAFVNLADARIVSGAGLMPAGRHGVLWRCRVCDVHGWALGELAPG